MQGECTKRVSSDEAKLLANKQVGKQGFPLKSSCNKIYLMREALVNVIQKRL